MTNFATRYDAVPDHGVLYDSLPVYAARKDTAFYLEEARQADGPILELGCGTGRILLPIARAGQAITGADVSPGMLARLREKLAAEPHAVRAAVTLHHADVRALSLGTAFALVFAPFRVLQHMTTIDDQLRFLAAAARHLAPGGRLIFDIFNPLWARMTSDRSAEVEDTPLQHLPDGRTVRRTTRVPRMRWLDQVAESELIYYVADRPGAPEKRFVYAFEMRFYTPAEIRHLLARTGLRETAMYGGFDRSAPTDQSPEMVWCAEHLR